MSTASSELDTLLASVGYLMTRYVLSPSSDVARGVVHQLEMLVAHSQVMTSPVARRTYRSLLQQWRTILERHDGAAGHAHSLVAPRVH